MLRQLADLGLRAVSRDLTLNKSAAWTRLFSQKSTSASKTGMSSQHLNDPFCSRCVIRDPREECMEDLRLSDREGVLGREMGISMPLMGTGEQARYISNRDTVQFEMAHEQGERVTCRIGYRALVLFACRLKASEEAMLAAFQEHRTEIESVADDCYERGSISADGKSIVIGLLDIQLCRAKGKIPRK